MTYNSNITEPYLVNHETFCSTWMSEVHLRCTPVIHSELKLKIFSVKGKKKKNAAMYISANFHCSHFQRLSLQYPSAAATVHLTHEFKKIYPDELAY